jgi:hypothetical protein
MKTFLLSLIFTILCLSAISQSKSQPPAKKNTPPPVKKMNYNTYYHSTKHNFVTKPEYKCPKCGYSVHHPGKCPHDNCTLI